MIKTQSLISSLLVALPLVMSVAARADGVRTVQLPGSDFWVSQGATQSLGIGWNRVQKIFVQAWAVGCNSEVEVIANGDTKGTLYLPGYDPSYVVTVDETVSTLEFRNISGCNAHIASVTAVMEIVAVQGPGVGHPDHALSEGALNSAAALCARTIDLVDALEEGADANSYVTDLLPIKKAAARAYALANARGAYSAQVSTALRALEAQIDAAQDYLDNTFERKDSFDSAVELLSVREKIDAILN